MASKFQTEYQRKKQAREKAIYAEFMRLTSNPEASIKEVNKYLMEKYEICSENTIWAIRKRVEGKPYRTLKSKQ